MLFHFQESSIEIVRERPYERLLTVMATKSRTLKEFFVRTPSQIVPVAKQTYKLILHISETNLPFFIEPETLAAIEVVERLTPEPAAYYCELAHPNSEGNLTFSGRFCWEEELHIVEDSLLANNEDMLGEPLFVPLFKVPMQLIHASNKQQNGDSARE